MKTYFTILILFISTNLLSAQEKGTIISIKDNLSKGIYDWDTTTAGRKPNELVIEKVKFVSGETSEHPDTASAYLFSVVKLYNGILNNYIMVSAWDGPYTKAYYIWENETTLAVRFIDSKTNIEGSAMMLELVDGYIRPVQKKE